MTPVEAEVELLTKIILGDSSDNIPKITNFILSNRRNEDNKKVILGDTSAPVIIQSYNNDIEKILEEIARRVYIKQFEDSYPYEVFKKEDLLSDEQIVAQNERKEAQKIIKAERKPLYIAPKNLKLIKEYTKEMPFDSSEKDLEQFSKEIVESDTKTDFVIEHTLADIAEKINKQFYHNQQIVDFDFIPKDLIEAFLSQLVVKEKTLEGPARSEVFLKYELEHLAKENDNYVKRNNIIDNQEEISAPAVEKEVKENSIAVAEVIPVLIEEGIKYVKITGNIPRSMTEGLLKIKVSKKLEFNSEENFWIFPTKSKEPGISEEIAIYNGKLVNRIKELVPFTEIKKVVPAQQKKVVNHPF